MGEFDSVKYRNEYAKEHYERLNILLPKGSKALIKKQAQEAGKSVSQYILDVIKEKEGEA